MTYFILWYSIGIFSCLGVCYYTGNEITIGDLLLSLAIGFFGPIIPVSLLIVKIENVVIIRRR